MTFTSDYWLMGSKPSEAHVRIGVERLRLLTGYFKLKSGVVAAAEAVKERFVTLVNADIPVIATG